MVGRVYLYRNLGLIILIPGALLAVLPAVWMISAAFQHNSQVLSFPPSLWPHPWTLNGIIKGFTALPFGRYFINTLTISISSSIGGVLSSSMAGFAFAKFRTRGKNVLFMAVLSGLMIPYAVVMIPQYELFKSLGWVNSFLPLIVPSWLGLPFLIFLFRQFFSGIPNEIFEAARIDGCGYFRQYSRIAMPLAVPAIATGFIFHFQASWNDFLGPLIYLNSNSNYTLSLGLASFTGACDCTPWNQLMAVSGIVALVPILIFFFAQNYVLRGIVVTSK